MTVVDICANDISATNIQSSTHIQFVDTSGNNLDLTNNLNIDNILHVKDSGYIGIGTNGEIPRAVLDISTTGIVILPNKRDDTTDDIDGAIRFNPTKSIFEAYKSSRWGSLGGVDDSSGTYITALDRELSLIHI